MPTFDYLCSCGKVTEEVFLLSEDVPKELPCKCGKKKVKQVGAPALHFKGNWPSKQIRNRRK